MNPSAAVLARRNPVTTQPKRGNGSGQNSTSVNGPTIIGACPDLMAEASRFVLNGHRQIGIELDASKQANHIAVCDMYVLSYFAAKMLGQLPDTAPNLTLFRRVLEKDTAAARKLTEALKGMNFSRKVHVIWSDVHQRFVLEGYGNGIWVSLAFMGLEAEYAILESCLRELHKKPEARADIFPHGKDMKKMTLQFTKAKAQLGKRLKSARKPVPSSR